MCLHRQQFLAIQELLLGHEFSYILFEKLESFPQLISHQVSDYIPKNLMEYTSKFLDYDTFTFWEVQNVSPLHGFFSLITLFLGMIICLFVASLKNHRFVGVYSKYIVQRLPRKRFYKAQNWLLIRTFLPNAIPQIISN